MSNITESNNSTIGQEIHSLAKRLWTLPRSISGSGLRGTLSVFKEFLPSLRLIEIPSGSKVLDWIIPDEWEILEGWLEGPDGRRIADFACNNLHVVGYSQGVDIYISLEDLQNHLHSLPDQPDAIPYVTSYYNRTWGFCISHRQREALAQGTYKARIVARHYPGSITIGELFLPGQDSREILLSTYCCHPSLANNELSGPCLTAHLALWLQSLSSRRFTYRVIFVPEMIGSIAYLSQHMDAMKLQTIAGFNITCVGDNRAWSYLPSRDGSTLADRISLHVLDHTVGEYHKYSWLDRGSDESNYCAPGIDLPVVTVCRSKYGTYPEYHTSLDDLERVVTPDGLEESFIVYKKILSVLERHCYPFSRVLGEPQLGRRGLYPSLSMKGSTNNVRQTLDLISLSDGENSLLEIADRCGVPVWDLFDPLDTLCSHGILGLRDLQ